jgi:hypothetical protein
MEVTPSSANWMSQSPIGELASSLFIMEPSLNLQIRSECYGRLLNRGVEIVEHHLSTQNRSNIQKQPKSAQELNLKPAIETSAILLSCWHANKDTESTAPNSAHLIPNFLTRNRRQRHHTRTGRGGYGHAWDLFTPGTGSPTSRMWHWCVWANGTDRNRTKGTHRPNVQIMPHTPAPVLHMCNGVSDIVAGKSGAEEQRWVTTGGL